MVKSKLLWTGTTPAQEVESATGGLSEAEGPRVKVGRAADLEVTDQRYTAPAVIAPFLLAIMWGRDGCVHPPTVINEYRIQDSLDFSF